MINGFHRLSYPDRLFKTGLPSLSKRRARGDLIQMFKIISGRSKLSIDSLFTFNNNNQLRGHKYKLFKLLCGTTARKQFFNNRLIDSWNGLPSGVVDSVSINAFKNSLDKCNYFMKDDD